MPVKPVDAATLKSWLDKGEAVIVDVREPAEHASSSIEGSVLMPLGGIKAAALPCCEGKKLVLHCQAGRRSASACEKLLAENPGLELYNLEGGIAGWDAAGLSVSARGRKLLPLDRQVQLAIGLLLLSGSIAGYLFSPAWFLLTGLIGLGLTVAGITGFCGLAMVLAKMPWNQNVKAAPSCCVK